MQQSGDLHNAVLAYRRAIQLDSGCFTAFNGLGTIFASLGDGGTALTFLNAALALEPRSAEIHNNVGNVQLAQGQCAAAIESYQKAIRIEPGSAKYHNHLGNGLRVAGEFLAAENAFRHALSLSPSYAEAWVNLGFLLAEQGNFTAAEEHYRCALRIKPGLALAHVNLSQLLLRRSEFPEGWAEAEWRWQWKHFPSPIRRFSQPQWRGEPLRGATILLHAEQGVGDTLQMLRYIPLLVERDARIVLEVPPELLSLLAPYNDVVELLTRGAAIPAFDCHCPLMSLPLAFSTTLQTIPCQTPYLPTPPLQQPAWLGPPRPSQLKVGLVWAGNPNNRIDQRRSLPLAVLAPMFAVAGVVLYSLQRGRASGEIAEVDLEFSGELPNSADFAQTASALAHLDLVITVDTSVAHLAGALGRPVWILLPFVADWRWLLEREDSPWYPSARLFRQSAPNAWSCVVQRMADSLAELAAERSQAAAWTPP